MMPSCPVSERVCAPRHERRAPRAQAAARGPRARPADADVLAAAGVPAPRRQPLSEGGGIRPLDRPRLRRAHGRDPAGDRHERRVLAARGQGHGRAHHRPLRPDRRRRRGGQGHLLAALGREHEPRHHRVPLPPDRGPELLPRRAAAVRADLGARPAERPQHVQRAALDRRALGLPRRQRPPPWRAGAQPPRAHRDAAHHAAVGGLPGLERLGAQRQADRAPA